MAEDDELTKAERKALLQDIEDDDIGEGLLSGIQFKAVVNLSEHNYQPKLRKYQRARDNFRKIANRSVQSYVDVLKKYRVRPSQDTEGKLEIWIEEKEKADADAEPQAEEAQDNTGGVIGAADDGNTSPYGDDIIPPPPEVNQPRVSLKEGDTDLTSAILGFGNGAGDNVGANNEESLSFLTGDFDELSVYGKEKHEAATDEYRHTPTRGNAFPRATRSTSSRGASATLPSSRVSSTPPRGISSARKKPAARGTPPSTRSALCRSTNRNAGNYHQAGGGGFAAWLKAANFQQSPDWTPRKGTIANPFICLVDTENNWNNAGFDSALITDHTFDNVKHNLLFIRLAYYSPLDYDNIYLRLATDFDHEELGIPQSIKERSLMLFEPSKSASVRDEKLFINGLPLSEEEGFISRLETELIQQRQDYDKLAASDQMKCTLLVYPDDEEKFYKFDKYIYSGRNISLYKRRVSVQYPPTDPRNKWEKIVKGPVAYFKVALCGASDIRDSESDEDRDKDFDA